MTETKPKKKKAPRLRARFSCDQLISKLDVLFSETNFGKDEELKNLAEKAKDEGYILLEDVLSKKKLARGRGGNRAFMELALSSEVFEILETNGVLKIRQKLDAKNLGKLCSIFVDCIPQIVDSDWVRSVFSKFGTITKLDIPLHKHKPKPAKRKRGLKPVSETELKRKNKGFAFVEFSSIGAARNALKNFSLKGQHTPAAKISADIPIASTSITTSKETENNMVPDEDVSTKKMRLDPNTDQDSAIIDSIAINKSVDLSVKPKESKIAAEQNHLRKQCRRKRKRHRYSLAVEKKMKKKADDVLRLKVYSLEEWEKLRSEYLGIQKRNFSELKKNLSSVSAELSEKNSGKEISVNKHVSSVDSGSKHERKLRGTQKIERKRDLIQEKRMFNNVCSKQK